MSDVRVIHGDSRQELKAFRAASFDSVVCDPPYALVSITKRFGAEGSSASKVGATGAYARASAGFMGQRWDTGETAFDPAFWAEVLRVLKPGAHLVAFSGTRTYHRMTCAIEDAGFDIRDQIGWAFGSGFPKSHKVGDGLGTALKPAWEPICLARAPLAEKSIAANVLAHGTGGLNIDSCRIKGVDAPERWAAPRGGGYQGGFADNGPCASQVDDRGRWPANLIHDGSEEVLSAFPQTSSGDLSGHRNSEKTKSVWGRFNDDGRSHKPGGWTGDSGSAARFFYSAKADAADRLGSKHPTVKPVDLMAYLCRLVTPPGGTVLDPFAGSGTTGMAAMREGFDAVLIEREAEYVADIYRRLQHVEGGDAPLFTQGAA